MLDAVVIACLCRQPVYFTIRSDMFRNPVFRFFLTFLNGIPVFRSSEEKEKLKENFNSISRCRNILKEGGIIIVFSEGITVHEWKLKPIKSATARIVQEALTDPQLIQTLKVVPVGLTYSDYAHPGKTIVIHTGEEFYPGRILPEKLNGTWKQLFSTLLTQRLEPLIPSMKSNEIPAKRIWQSVLTNIPLKNNCNTCITLLQIRGETIAETPVDPQFAKKITNPFFLPATSNHFKNYILLTLLGIPAFAGLLLNGIYYFPVTRFAREKTKNSIFYDSLSAGLLTILYPAYLLFISLILSVFSGISWVIWMILIPCSGWCTLQFWIQYLKVKNDMLLTPREREFMQELLQYK